MNVRQVVPSRNWRAVRKFTINFPGFQILNYGHTWFNKVAGILSIGLPHPEGVMALRVGALAWNEMVQFQYSVCFPHCQAKRQESVITWKGN